MCWLWRVFVSLVVVAVVTVIGWFVGNWYGWFMYELCCGELICFGLDFFVFFGGLFLVFVGFVVLVGGLVVWVLVWCLIVW